MAGVWLGAAVVARHRAQSAADLAALAAAAPAGRTGGGVPGGDGGGRCDEGDDAGVRCRAPDVVVAVTTQADVRLMGQASAAARAGPVVGVLWLGSCGWG